MNGLVFRCFFVVTQLSVTHGEQSCFRIQVNKPAYLVWLAHNNIGCQGISGWNN